MSSSRFATAISIRPKPSNILAVSVIGIHFGALLTLLGLGAAGEVKLLLAGVVAISLIVAVRTHLLMLGNRSVRQFLWPYSGPIRIEGGEGKEHEVEVAQDSVVYPWIMVLNLIDESRTRHTLILLPDSADKQVMRRLRTRLLLDKK